MEHGSIKPPLWEMHFHSSPNQKNGITHSSQSNLEKRALEAFFDIKNSYEQFSKDSVDETSPFSADEKLENVIDTLKNFSALMEELDESTPPEEIENE